MGLFNLSLFTSDTKEAVFWKWFEQNEARLFTFEKDREKIFNELSVAMRKVHPDLAFEFGPVLEDGRREFIISAGGIKDAFPAVKALHGAAPTLARWTFVKFRPRRTPMHDLEYAGRKVRAEDVHYLLFKDDKPGKLGVMLFLDGYKQGAEEWGQIGYLSLDEALGEYDVEMKVGAIVFQSRDSKYFARAHQLAELPEDFDDVLAKSKK